MFSFHCLLIIVLCEFLVCASTVKISSKPKAKSYVAVLNRIVPCETPSEPYMKHPSATLDITMKNKLVKGNFTVTGKSNNLLISITDLEYVDGQWRTGFVARNVTCRSKWISVFLDATRVQYNRKTCTVPKGSYVFEVEYNKLEHIMMPFREYGKVVRRVEVLIKVGGSLATLACFEFESEIKAAGS